MNVFELTRTLVDIESISDNEMELASRLHDELATLANASGGRVERMEVTANRFNVFAYWGKPLVTLSTHMDTVPPFFPSREDPENIWGRGSCDAKGIIASMPVGAARKLAGPKAELIFGLLFVVGEERNSAGAIAASSLSARIALSGEWGADGKQAGPCIERRAALRDDRAWASGALRLH